MIPALSPTFTALKPSKAEYVQDLFNWGSQKPTKTKSMQKWKRIEHEGREKNTDSQQTFRTEKHEQIVLTCFNMNQNEAG